MIVLSCFRMLYTKVRTFGVREWETITLEPAYIVLLMHIITQVKLLAESLKWNLTIWVLILDLLVFLNGYQPYTHTHTRARTHTRVYIYILFSLIFMLNWFLIYFYSLWKRVLQEEFLLFCIEMALLSNRFFSLIELLADGFTSGCWWLQAVGFSLVKRL